MGAQDEFISEEGEGGTRFTFKIRRGFARSNSGPPMSTIS